MIRAILLQRHHKGTLHSQN